MERIVEERVLLWEVDGEIVHLTTGESYTTRSGAREGCDAVKRAAAAATVEDA